jgi:hypothetical protein
MYAPTRQFICLPSGLPEKAASFESATALRALLAIFRATWGWAFRKKDPDTGGSDTFHKRWAQLSIPELAKKNRPLDDRPPAGGRPAGGDLRQEGPAQQRGTQPKEDFRFKENLFRRENLCFKENLFQEDLRFWKDLQRSWGGSPTQLPPVLL